MRTCLCLYPSPQDVGLSHFGSRMAGLFRLPWYDSPTTNMATARLVCRDASNASKSKDSDINKEGDLLGSPFLHI